MEAPSPGGRGAAPAGGRPRRRDARSLVHVDADPDQPAPCPVARRPRRRAAGSRLRSLAPPGGRAQPLARAEHALELVGRRDLELIVAAIPRPLVRAPAPELRGVAKSGALNVVGGDVHDAVGPERSTAQGLPPMPYYAPASATLGGRA